MLNVSLPSPGLLFCSFLYRTDKFQPEELAGLWTKHFGKSFEFKPTFNPLVSYYAQEMGPHLGRIFLTPSETQPRDSLLSTKLLALEWERQHAEDGKRTVNVDIGFLSAENFLLATTKSYSHRVYLAQGIYAELTYQTTWSTLEPFPWTYPDYRDAEKIEYFLWLRSYLLQKLATLPK